MVRAVPSLCGLLLGSQRALFRRLLSAQITSRVESNGGRIKPKLSAILIWPSSLRSRVLRTAPLRAGSAWPGRIFFITQDAMAVFAHGRARRLHHDAFGKEDRLVGQNERTLPLPKSHTRRISAPSWNSWQGDAIPPLCEPGDRAMWIVMYVTMIASLSAMGMLPVAEYRDQLPHDDA
jgi:hypothetical protein